MAAQKPRQAAAEYSQFANKLKRLEGEKKSLRRSFQSGYLTKAQAALFYELLGIKLVASFETFLEVLLVGLTLGNISHQCPRVRPHFTAHPTLNLRKLLGPREYLAFLPMNSCYDLAERCLHQGLPFTGLKAQGMSNSMRLLYELQILRNYAAHSSRSAREKLARHFGRPILMLPSSNRAGEYLMSTHRVNPFQDKLDLYIMETDSIAQYLCSRKSYPR